MGLAGVAWVEAVGRLGGSATDAARSAAELEGRYAQPQRRYHATTHVDAVVRDSAWLAAELGLAADDRAVVALAACAHDVVYDAHPGADERASAEWAGRTLAAAGVTPAVIRRVQDLVLLTISHQGGTDDPVAGALLDADLAILGSAPDAYAGYVRAVRDEYRAVPDEQWRVGRTQVLQALLDQQPLFVTEPARLRWEEPARRNVRAELDGLDA